MGEALPSFSTALATAVSMASCTVLFIVLCIVLLHAERGVEKSCVESTAPVCVSGGDGGGGSSKKGKARQKDNGKTRRLSAGFPPPSPLPFLDLPWPFTGLPLPYIDLPLPFPAAFP